MGHKTEHFFTDSGSNYRHSSSYGRSGYGRDRPLTERQRIEKAIEALRLRLWDGGSDAEDKRDIDEQVEKLKARLRFLREHPEQDMPS